MRMINKSEGRLNIQLVRNFLISFVRRNIWVFIFSVSLFLISLFGTIIIQVLEEPTVSNSPTLTSGEELEINEVVWFSIFKHNFFMLTPVLLGVFTLGFISIIYLVLQGYLLGVSIYSIAHDLSFLTIIKYTLIHGIFEVVAISLVASFSIKPGYIVINSIFRSKNFINKQDLLDMLCLLILYVVFLFSASIVEGLVEVYL